MTIDGSVLCVAPSLPDELRRAHTTMPSDIGSTRRSSKVSRGYFGVAVWNPKKATNVGGVLRTAHVMGAAFVAVFGNRYQHQHSDVTKAYRHVPFFQFDDSEDFWRHIPRECEPVAVEVDVTARNLCTYNHPERAVYIVGPEDGSLPRSITDRCTIVQIPGRYCLNLATAASVVMYDRISKEVVS